MLQQWKNFFRLVFFDPSLPLDERHTATDASSIRGSEIFIGGCSVLLCLFNLGYMTWTNYLEIHFIWPSALCLTASGFLLIFSLKKYYTPHQTHCITYYRRIIFIITFFAFTMNILFFVGILL